MTFFCHSFTMMASVEVALFSCLFLLSNSLGFGEEIPCNGTSNGTLCLQNETSTCVGYKENLLTLADKNYLLWVHTSLRENMTKEVNGKLPKAFFMKKLTWNDDLANMAQAWAENCRATKQPHLLLGNQPLGQLVLTADQSMSRNLPRVIGKWTVGLKYLNPEIIAKYQKPTSRESDYEPVAQMIWWNTSQIGCGRSSYKLKNCDEKVKNCAVVELVCNYFPAGNREGEPVYIITNDNNLICQYDNKNIHCKNIGSNKEKNPNEIIIPKEKEDIFNNRVRNRMLELWPAAAGASSTWEWWDIRSFYILLAFTTFNLYGVLLRN